MSAQSEENTNPVRKSSRLWLLAIIAVIAITAGVCLYFNVGLPNSAAQSENKNIKSMTLPSFTVNLADAGGNHYLKTTITLEFSSDAVGKELEKTTYRVRDSILKVLRNTRAITLSSPQGTEALKQQLLTEINSTLTSGKVTGLYFEEFLVQ